MLNDCDYDGGGPIAVDFSLFMTQSLMSRIYHDNARCDTKLYVETRFSNLRTHLNIHCEISNLRTHLKPTVDKLN